MHTYAVAGDGQRFLLDAVVEQQPELFGWPANVDLMASGRTLFLLTSDPLHRELATVDGTAMS
jgi:hypothetical protein